MKKQIRQALMMDFRAMIPTVQSSTQASSGVAVAVNGKVKALSHAGVLSVPIRRIVAFHLNGLDDLLFSLPALAALRDSFPGAVIISVLRPALAPLLRHAPYVDEVWHRPKGGLSAQAALMAKLHAGHFDIAVCFSQNRNMTLLAWSSGAPVRAGYADAKMEALLTHRVAKDGPPRLETHLELARAVGCKTHYLDYGGLLHTGVDAKMRADKLLQERGIAGEFLLAAVAPGEKRHTIRQWPLELWRQSLQVLGARRAVVLVGNAPCAELTHLPAVHDLGGSTDLETLAALCDRACLFVGPDGGMLHLAAAMQTPVVGIYGPENEKCNHPRGVPFRIVRGNSQAIKETEEDQSKSSAPQQIAHAVAELLGV